MATKLTKSHTIDITKVSSGVVDGEVYTHTLCGKEIVGPLVIAVNGVPTCSRCMKKYHRIAIELVNSIWQLN